VWVSVVLGINAKCNLTKEKYEMINPVLILDLDGVLITTPMWKPEEIESDGYSKFNEKCVSNLNHFLSLSDFEIWLSSTRRTVKLLDEFNLIFFNRNITIPIMGFSPEYPNCKNRREEVLRFIEEFATSEFIIFDDDKPLNGLNEKHKERLVLTDLLKGLDDEKLELT
jgi:hypothetical protein